MPDSTPHKAVISDIKQESLSTKTFILKPEEAFCYQSGQFITFLFPSPHKGKELLERRAYSFSSAPGIDAKPAVTIKRVDNGLASRQLIDRYQPGDILDFSHISGNFTLPEDENKPKHFMFFAAGSGITPVFSLIKTILKFYPKWHITLDYSSHSVSDTLFYEELTALSNQYPQRLLIIWQISRQNQNGRLSHFSLNHLLKKYGHQNAVKTYFYLCGPFEYMDMIEIVLLTDGVKPQYIKKEHFYIPRSDDPPEPPDKKARNITIHINGKTYHFISKYPKSILESALENNVPMTFSCRSGQCGSCLSRCIKGKTWMRYNEVLTKSEIEEGYVLTCNAFPIDGAVEFEK